MTIFVEGRPLWLPKLSIFLTTSEPSVTSPKTTCLPSSQLVITVVMKNGNRWCSGPRSPWTGEVVCRV